MSTRIWCHSKEWYWHWLVNTWASSSLMDVTRKGFEILHWALPLVCLPSVYLISPRPSHSVFTYCKRSKAGGGNGLGTRLTWIILCCVLLQLHLAPDFDCNLVEFKFPWREWRRVGTSVIWHQQSSSHNNRTWIWSFSANIHGDEITHRHMFVKVTFCSKLYTGVHSNTTDNYQPNMQFPW